MEPPEVIHQASELLIGMNGHTFEQLTVHRPLSLLEALSMVKINSKISSLVGNLFKINAVKALAADPILGSLGNWIRQDPGFPDVLLDWEKPIKPGFEVNAWYPMSTEITGRFKNSQNALIDNATNVALFAWLPERLLWGKPKVIKIAVVPGISVAAARDSHTTTHPNTLSSNL